MADKPNGGNGNLEETLKETVPLHGSSAQDFRKTWPVQLSSGRWVEIRQISLTSLVSSGRIPNPLMATAYKIAEQGTEEVPEEEDDTSEGKLKSHQDYHQALDAMVVALVLSPKFCVSWDDEEKENAIWVGHLTDYDKRAILQFSQAGTEFLDSFRKRAASPDPVQDGGEVRG